MLTLKGLGVKPSSALLGALGAAIHHVGSRIPVSIKKKVGLDKDWGISEALETLGGRGLEVKAQETKNNPLVNEIREKTLSRTGEYSSSGPSVQYPNLSKLVGKSEQDWSPSEEQKIQPVSKKYYASELSSLTGLPESELWDHRQVEINGKKYEVRDTGGGMRTLTPLETSSPKPKPRMSRDEFLRHAVSKGYTAEIPEGELNSLYDEMLRSGEDFASGLEKRARARAERRWQAIKDMLSRERSELGTTSKEQIELLQKSHNLSKKELEQRKERELKDIERQKAETKEGYRENKEELGTNLRDLFRKFEAVMRGTGTAVSAFTQGYEAKMIRDFNRGVRKLQLHERGALEKLNDAVRTTNEIIDNKIKELDLDLQKGVKSVNQWVRSRINDIQSRENMALNDKFDEIEKAVDEANKLIFNIKNNIAQQKINWAKWVKQMAIKARYAGATASKDLNAASKQISLLQKTANLMKTVISSKMGSIYTDDAGNKHLVGYLPFGQKIDIPVDDATAENVKKELEKQKGSVLDQLIGGVQQKLQSDVSQSTPETVSENQSGNGSIGGIIEKALGGLFK